MLKQIIAAGALAAGAIGATAGMAQASTVPQVYSAQAAGFQAGDPGASAPWHYRYVQTEVTLPDVTGSSFKAAMPNGFGASVRLADAGQTVDLGISTTPASGVYNAAFALENSDGKTYGAGSCLDGNSPQVQAGDTVVLELFYGYQGYSATSQVGNVSYAVKDLTDSTKDFSGTCTDPAQMFTTAQIVNGFAANDYGTATVGKVNGNQRLDTFTATVVTNRTGLRGSAGAASWPVQTVALTSDGKSTGATGASTPFAWGTYKTGPDAVVRGGRNFSVWLPAYPG